MSASSAKVATLPCGTHKNLNFVLDFVMKFLHEKYFVLGYRISEYQTLIKCTAVAITDGFRDQSLSHTRSNVQTTKHMRFVH